MLIVIVICSPHLQVVGTATIDLTSYMLSASIGGFYKQASVLSSRSLKVGSFVKILTRLVAHKLPPSVISVCLLKLIRVGSTVLSLFVVLYVRVDHINSLNQVLLVVLPVRVELRKIKKQTLKILLKNKKEEAYHKTKS